MSTIGGNLTWQMSSSWWAESSKMTLYHAATVLIRWPVSGTACLQWLTVGWTLAWPGYTAGCLLWVVPHLGRTWLFSRRSRDWTLSLTPGRKRLHLVQVKRVCEWGRGEGGVICSFKKIQKCDLHSKKLVRPAFKLWQVGHMSKSNDPNA